MRRRRATAGLARKLRTTRTVFATRGARGVASVAVRLAGAWWRQGDRWWLGKFGGAQSRVVRLDGCRFALDDPAVPQNIRDLLRFADYEKPEREALRRFLDPTLPVIELGACIGVVACVTNRRLRHPERHIVVEANPSLLPVLEANRGRNRRSFTILNRAIAYDSDPVVFHIHEDVLASSVRAAADKSVRVPSTTLTRLLSEFGVERCTLICDIEGAEWDLVAREHMTVRENVAMLILELHEHVLGVEAASRLLLTLEQDGLRRVYRNRDTYVFINCWSRDRGRRLADPPVALSGA